MEDPLISPARRLFLIVVGPVAAIAFTVAIQIANPQYNYGTPVPPTVTMPFVPAPNGQNR